MVKVLLDVYTVTRRDALDGYSVPGSYVTARVFDNPKAINDCRLWIPVCGRQGYAGFAHGCDARRTKPRALRKAREAVLAAFPTATIEVV